MAVRNKSSIFILPMITGIPYVYFREFINCYIGCNHDVNEFNNRRVYIAFKTDDLKKDTYKSSEKKEISNESRIKILTDSELFIRDIVVNDYTIFIFEPSSEFKDDFDNFSLGKYSLFSEKYKKLLRSLYPTINKLKSIINPTDEDREKLAKELMCNKQIIKNSEIYSIPEPIEETFTLAHFLNVEL